MKNILFFCLSLCMLASCEIPISVKTDTTAPLLTVDGWINNRDTKQVIRLTTTVPYFQNAPAPVVSGANVQVLEFDENEQLLDTYNFTQASNGSYEANFTGQIGRKYRLLLTYQGESFTAQTSLNRVPPIDSLTSEFRKEPLGQLKGYYVNFYARDLVGRGDYYRFRVWRNGVMFNRPENLSAWDDNNTDGLPFIPPIRGSFNPFFDVNGIEPHKVGDVVRAEILSIDEEAYRFFLLLNEQVNNSGLFALPIANVPTNVQNTNLKGKKAVGCFYASAISSMEVTIKKDPKEDE